MTINDDMIEYAEAVIKDFGYGRILRGNEIKRAMNQRYGQNEKNILPPDHCYNRVNKDIVRVVDQEVSFNKSPLFIYRGKSMFECVGAHHLYDGPVYWNPKGSEEVLVGKCANGRRIIDPKFLGLFR